MEAFQQTKDRINLQRRYATPENFVKSFQVKVREIMCIPVFTTIHNNWIMKPNNRDIDKEELVYKRDIFSYKEESYVISRKMGKIGDYVKRIMPASERQIFSFLVFLILTFYVNT